MFDVPRLSNASVALPARFTERLGSSAERPRDSKVKPCAPWFNNFGSSATLAEHLRMLHSQSLINSENGYADVAKWDDTFTRVDTEGPLQNINEEDLAIETSTIDDSASSKANSSAPGSINDLASSKGVPSSIDVVSSVDVPSCHDCGEPSAECEFVRNTSEVSMVSTVSEESSRGFKIRFSRVSQFERMKAKEPNSFHGKPPSFISSCFCAPTSS